MFRDRGAARIRLGHTAVFDRVDPKHAAASLTHLQQDSSGTMWAVLNGQELVSLGPDEAWHLKAGPLQGPAHITSLFIDSADTQWVVANDLLYKRPSEQTSFIPTKIHAAGGTKVVEASDHTLWVVGRVPGTGKPGHEVDLQHIDQFANRLHCPDFTGDLRGILPMPDGSLWLSEAGRGLLRLPQVTMIDDPTSLSEPHDRYTISDGLTSVEEWALSSDADGNIWAGGVSGLDRFEPAALVPAIGGAHSGYWYLCANQQGDIWGAEEEGPVFSFAHGRLNRVAGRDGIEGLFCGLDRKLWVVDRWGAGYIQNGRIHQLPGIPGQPRHRDSYHFASLAEIKKDELVAAPWGPFADRLWNFRRGRWEAFLTARAATRINVLKAVGAQLYLGYRDGKIEVFQADTRQKLSAADPGVGEMVGFAKTSQGVFALGFDGIAAERGDTFERLSFLHTDSAVRVSGLVESRNGDFWLNGARGIVHIPRREIVAALASPSHRISSDEVHEGNFVGPAYCPVGRESASIDPSGKLWFATLNGVVSIDPGRLRLPQHPPQLSIRSITADGRPVDHGSKFPPDIQTLAVRYFGLDLTDPKRVIYRYRLNGLDDSWQDVGSRTEALYTHLRPGQYSFQVMASNGNDVWTTPVSSVTFTILPRFYERRWFQVLAVLASVLLVWFGLSLRVRHVSRDIKIRAEERANERIQIARDLHDTLLQGVQGLLLSFHVAAQKVPPDHESKRALEKALTTADQIILEGRNRVSRLRSDDLTDAELTSLIEGVAANLNDAGGVEFAVERTGGKDSLRRDVADEVFNIAREALTNAFRHSEASRVVVELDYDKRKFRMSCHDNGRGFDVGALQANGKNGHWGLLGMEERAAKIGGEFSCKSATGKGTEVSVHLPARRAYVGTTFRLFSHRRPEG
jgi:signal transduction histidine kinase